LVKSHEELEAVKDESISKILRGVGLQSVHDLQVEDMAQWLRVQLYYVEGNGLYLRKVDDIQTLPTSRAKRDISIFSYNYTDNGLEYFEHRL